MNIFQRVSFFIKTGDAPFIAVQHNDMNDKWGIYHSWRHHSWGYDLTKEEAEHRVRVLNQAILDGRDTYKISF